REVAADLRAHAKAGIVLAGRRQPPLVHALAHALNAALSNHGWTITFLEEPKSDAGTIAELARRIQGDQVETLVILGGNPAYNAPADLRFAELLRGVPYVIRHALHADET